MGFFPLPEAEGAKPDWHTTLNRTPSDLAKLAEPELFLVPLAERLVILDEIQLKADLFGVLRSLVDARRKPGRFLILGSAAPALIQHSSETLAGRVDFLELAP